MSRENQQDVVEHSHKKRGWRYYRNLIVFAILTLTVALYFTIYLYEANFRMHPIRFQVGPASPADLSLDYTDVAFPTRDGLTLRGWYVPSTNGAAVILIHAFNDNRTGTLYHAALLADHGYGVLLYDTRSQGESEGDLYTWGWDAHQDVIAALDYVQHRSEVDSGRIGVLGLSAGAAIALRAGAETHDIAAVAGLLPQGVALPLDVEMMERLTDYATVTRYPGGYDPVTREDAEEAVEAARRVREAARNHIPPEALGTA